LPGRAHQRLRSAPARARRRLLLASLAGVIAALAGLGAAFHAAASPPVTEAGTCAAAGAAASCAACLRAVRAAPAPRAARRPGPSR